MARLLALVLCWTASAWAVDCVYHNGNIHTLDPQRPRVEALAVVDGRIVALGSDVQMLALAGPDTRRVDLLGRCAVPGLIDAHGHLGSLGSLQLGRIDLVDTRSYEELLAYMAAVAARTPAGEWLLGGRWDQANWGQSELPHHAPLSEQTPEHPVWLVRVDGHSGLANARAMQLAGITRDTPDPVGGAILKDAAGNPSGVLVDNAMALISRKIPGGGTDPSQALLAGQQACLAVGLTGVHDAGISVDEVRLYKRLADAGQLRLRVYAMLSARAAPAYLPENPPLIGYGGERFSLRAVKCMVDGAMGSRGAWLLEPYSDRPLDDQGEPYTGLPVQAPERILAVSQLALRHGWQVATHAIGDRGNREVLDAYAQALHEQPRREHRFRVEHAQCVSLADIPRFAALGVIPSMQPTHATSDMRWAELRVGPERIRGAYAWARFLRSGSRIAGGSDFPVESENPLLGIYAAVTRQSRDGEPGGGWRPEERLTREEALRVFTIDAAYAAFEESSKGSLEVGKLADFAVFSGDILSCPAAELLEIECTMTVIGGEPVFVRE